MLQILDQATVIFIYIILILITAFFLFQISPITFFKGTKNLVRSSKKPSEDSAKPSKPGKKLGQLEIKVNSGLGGEQPAIKQPASKFLGKVPTKTMPAEPATPKEPTALVAVNAPDWKMPSTDLLEKKHSPADAGNIQQNAIIIRDTFAQFGIEVEMEGANVGPHITQYTMKPPEGVNLTKITRLDRELALNLAVEKVRIEAPIPGTRSVGVEISNVRSADVRLRAILESPEWKKSDKPLTFALGKDVSGSVVVTDLAATPHLLIAGTTGSGKSVMTNMLITSLLYRNSPSDLKLILIDPKQVEMTQYADIPHLLTPVITQSDKAISAIKWSVNEMERRYTLLAKEHVKTIVDFNKKVEASQKANPDAEDQLAKMPYIVIVIDEMADLMMEAKKELEIPLVRIAQKGRAAGMHLVLATQKPVVTVVTGLIKSNVPSRIAFSVTSSNDSRVMIDQNGAEKLLGHGDMLFQNNGAKPRRIQGAWTPDADIEKVTEFLRAQRTPEYNDEVVAQQVAIKGAAGGDSGLGDLGRRFDPNDPVVRRAVEITINNGKFSTSSLQVHLSKGHGFVAGLAIWFEEIGIIGPANGNKPREVLISSLEEFDQLANM